MKYLLCLLLLSAGCVQTHDTVVAEDVNIIIVIEIEPVENMK
jgi:hypothetical protein